MINGCFPAPIIFALLLNEVRNVRFKKVVQMGTYMPHFISVVVACSMVLTFVSRDGLVNMIIGFFGHESISFMSEPKYFRTIYIISNLWQNLGWSSIIYVSALSSIDKQLYEAAAIDGANRWKQMIHVTMPGILPTVTILLILTVLLLLTVYPCWYVLVSSLGDPVQMAANGGLALYPKGFSVEAYNRVLHHKQLWISYRNTIFYVLSGGILSVFFTVTSAFALTRKGMPGRNIFMFLILFTMYFSGGMIPTYLVVKSLKMLNTPWAIILPGMISTYNLIVTIPYIKGLPSALEEAAKVDGASEYVVLFKIVIPLCKPIIAVISLYYMVALWNNYFSAMIYINKPSLYPLQLVLREILITNNTTSFESMNGGAEAAAYTENLKYAVIVVSTIPVLCVYPFVQKYFIKGVMIGAVKE